MHWTKATILSLSAALFALFLMPSDGEKSAAGTPNSAIALHEPADPAVWSDCRCPAAPSGQWSSSHRRFEPLAGGAAPSGILSSTVRLEIVRQCGQPLPPAAAHTAPRSIRYKNDPVRAGPRLLA